MKGINDEGLMTEAVRTSVTSVYFHDTTRQYILEGCHIHMATRSYGVS
jgi:hypothetical protein